MNQYIKIGLIFMLGMAIGYGTADPEIKTVEVEKVVEVEKNIADWHMLKQVDDGIMGVSGELMGFCSDGIYALVADDSDGINKATEGINTKAEELKMFKTSRESVLSRLGY